ncbi:MAG TPA: ABC transporter permease [Gemmatimonadales bacterium]|nr:ABC transporter permease [Gemmatimonadales bacterium]
MRNSMLPTSFRIGVESLRANPLRSVLSTLGVIFGVASLVSVLAIGDGAEQFARDQIAETTDLQTIVVIPNTGETIDGVRIPRARYPVFTMEDVASLAAAVGPAAHVAATVTGSARLRADSARAAIVVGVTPEAEERLRPVIRAGRFLAAEDMGRRVAVVTEGLARVLAAGVGDSIVLDSASFEVIGVLSPATKTLGGNSAVVPFPVADAAMAPPASPRAPQLFVRAVAVESVDSVRAATERWAAGRLGPRWREDASVGSGAPQLRIDQAEQGILIFKMVMGTFAGISLIVGGIGIMNVLLAGVTERTREIGIRKAIGARQRDILLQFLSESVAISGLGSVLGVALGLIGAFGATAVIRSASNAQLHAAFTWGTVAVAALISVLVGLAFGTYPALRAARLSPIEAIRHE